MFTGKETETLCAFICFKTFVIVSMSAVPVLARADTSCEESLLFQGLEVPQSIQKVLQLSRSQAHADKEKGAEILQHNKRPDQHFVSW